MDRRRGRGCAFEPRRVGVDADAAARRLARRPVERHERSSSGRCCILRVSSQNIVVVNLPAHRCAGLGAHADVTYAGRLEPQELDADTIDARAGRSRSARRLPGDPRRSRAILLQQPQLLVSAGAGHRLRDGDAPHHRAGELRRASPAAQPVPQRRRLAARQSSPGTKRPRAVFIVPRRRSRLRYLALRRQPLRAHRRSTVDASRIRRRRRRTCDRSRVERRRRRTRAQMRAAGPHGEPAADIVAVLRVAHRRRAVPGVHARAGRKRAAGRPQPGLLRGAQPAAADRRRVSWRNDPASFDGFPEFFLAHELAHQWWGQAVGWKNYHEQWLSEGFAQYFAALYAQQQRGDEVFASVLRQLRRWAMDESDQGPVYLGYRLGHIKGDSRGLPRARLQQGRGGAAHAAAAGRRRGVLRGAAPLLRGRRGSRRPAPTTSARRWRRSRAGRSSASSSAGSTVDAAATARSTYRVEGGDEPWSCDSSRLRRGVRRAGHGDARLRGQARRADVVVPVTERRHRTTRPARRARAASRP